MNEIKNISDGKWHITTVRITNGYEFKIYSEHLLIGVLYGSTNPMWDFVPGSNEGLANANFIVNAANEFNIKKLEENK
jgi:hypothetical protein